MDELKPQAIKVTDEVYEWLLYWLEQPTRPCSRLAKLFREDSPFEHPAASEDQAGARITEI